MPVEGEAFSRSRTIWGSSGIFSSWLLAPIHSQFLSFFWASLGLILGEPPFGSPPGSGISLHFRPSVDLASSLFLENGCGGFFCFRLSRISYCNSRFTL